MQVTGYNFQYGPNLGFPLDPSFWLWCSFFSWKSVFTTGHWICELWEFCSIFRHEILSDFNNIQESCIYTKFAQFVLLWQLFNSFSILLQWKIFVGWVITIQRYFCLDHTEHEWGTRLPHHNGSPRSLVKGFILFTYLRDCSVKTELICRDNYAKNSLNRYQIGCIVYRQFSMTFAF